MFTSRFFWLVIWPCGGKISEICVHIQIVAKKNLNVLIRLNGITSLSLMSKSSGVSQPTAVSLLRIILFFFFLLFFSIFLAQCM